MSELGDLRRLFTKLVITELTPLMYQDGLEIALDFVKRCETCTIGRYNSVHKLGLAVDIHLYKHKDYLEDTESHKKYGEFWEKLDPSCRWGGRFRRADGNHYSMIYMGMC